MSLPAAVQVIASRALTADQLHSAGEESKALTVALAVCRSDVPELVEAVRYNISRATILAGRVDALERQIAELRSGKNDTAVIKRRASE